MERLQKITYMFPTASEEEWKWTSYLNQLLREIPSYCTLRSIVKEIKNLNLCMILIRASQSFNLRWKQIYQEKKWSHYSRVQSALAFQDWKTYFALYV